MTWEAAFQRCSRRSSWLLAELFELLQITSCLRSHARSSRCDRPASPGLQEVSNGATLARSLTISCQVLRQRQVDTATMTTGVAQPGAIRLTVGLFAQRSTRRIRQKRKRTSHYVDTIHNGLLTIVDGFEAWCAPLGLDVVAVHSATAIRCHEREVRALQEVVCVHGKCLGTTTFIRSNSKMAWIHRVLSFYPMLYTSWYSAENNNRRIANDTGIARCCIRGQSLKFLVSNECCYRVTVYIESDFFFFPVFHSFV